MEPQLPSTYKITMSLTHYINVMLLRRDEADDPAQEKIAKVLRLCYTKLVEPLAPKAKEFKKQRAIEKQMPESEVIPPVVRS